MDKNNKKSKYNVVVRWMLIAAGTFSLLLGILGIVLPLLPTTPFLLLSAASYAKSSDRFYNSLINNRFFGRYIRNYREGKGIPLKIKISAISFLWITILVTVFFFVPLFPVKALLILIAGGVTFHIIRLPG